MIWIQCLEVLGGGRIAKNAELTKLYQDRQKGGAIITSLSGVFLSMEKAVLGHSCKIFTMKSFIFLDGSIQWKSVLHLPRVVPWTDGGRLRRALNVPHPSTGAEFFKPFHVLL